MGWGGCQKLFQGKEDYPDYLDLWVKPMCGWVEFHAFPQLRILLDKTGGEMSTPILY